MSSDQDEEESPDQSKENFVQNQPSDKKSDQPKKYKNLNFLNGKKVREIKFNPFDMTESNNEL